MCSCVGACKLLHSTAPDETLISVVGEGKKACHEMTGNGRSNKFHSAKESLFFGKVDRQCV